MHVTHDQRMLVSCVQCIKEEKYKLYIDKTIVEEEAEKGGAHSRLLGDSRLHNGPDRRQEIRARPRVEVGSELSRGAP